MMIAIAVLALVANFVSGHYIDLKQYQSMRVGKLKHNWAVLIINGVTFAAIVSWAGYWVLTAWALILSVGFLLPLAQVPYNGKYNVNFGSGWNRFRTLKHWTYATAFLAWMLF